MTLEYDGVTNISGIRVGSGSITGNSRRIEFPRDNTHSSFMAGNVGIGTTNPISQLHVGGTGLQRILVSSTDNQAGIEFRSDGTGNSILYSPTGSDDLRYFNGGDRVTFAADGNVGIGTTTPGAKLEVRAGSEGQLSPVEAIRIWGANTPTNANSAQDLKWDFAAAGSAGIRSYRGVSWDTYLQFLTNVITQESDNPQVRMHINHNGNVGIGTTAPGAKLEVSGKLLFTGDANAMSRSPRVIHTEDPGSGCPSTAAANSDLMIQSFTLANAAMVQISASMIRQAAGRVDLLLFVDGTQVDQSLTYQATVQWEDAHVRWSGTLAAGAHTVSLRSPTANVWGCGAVWGSIDTIIFEQLGVSIIIWPRLHSTE